MSPSQNYDFIRDSYGLNLGRGVRVRALGEEGVVVGADHRVYVKLDGEKHGEPYHPGDIEVL